MTELGGDQGLLAEIPAGIADLLHDRARERYLRRVWQTLALIVLVAFLAVIAPSTALTSEERLAGTIAALGFLGYLAYGFAWKWPERWEHQLLLEEIEHRRRLGKWRWEK
jgi:hypothetical protein